MIDVTFSAEETDITLKIKGHAGHDEFGKDIVCSASSILAYTLAQTLEDMYLADMLRKKPQIDLKSGDATIVCSPKKKSYMKAIQCYKVVQNGFRLLALNYPQYVALRVFGESYYWT